MEDIFSDKNYGYHTIFTFDGKFVGGDMLSLQSLESGLYIVNVKNIYLNNYNFEIE